MDVKVGRNKELLERLERQAELKRLARNARQREWYKRNRGKWNTYMKEWRDNNPDKVDMINANRREKRKIDKV